MKYQLPCPCGLCVEIEPSQAGQTVVCACGENLLVPSMLQVKTLRGVPETTKPPHKEMGILRRTFLIFGIVLFIPAILLAWHLYQRAPQPRDVSLKQVFFSFGTNKRMLFQDSTPISNVEHTILWMTDEYIDQMMPMDLYFYFRTLEKPMFGYNVIDNYDALKDRHRIWVTVDIILFFLAVLGVVASFFMPKQNAVVTGWSGSDWQRDRLN